MIVKKAHIVGFFVFVARDQLSMYNIDTVLVERYFNVNEGLLSQERTMGHFDNQLLSMLQAAPEQKPTFPTKGRMYAIAFDLDTDVLKTAYGKPSWQNAYGEIKAILVAKGFTWQQGSVYFGGPDLTAVQCVLAAQAVSAALPWFKTVVRDIRMLRIEELNDLSPAL